MNNQLYNDYGTWIRTVFPYRVQKISVDAGFTCPNRDGSIGSGGCTFCDNNTFNPPYCNPAHTIAAQLEAGKAFFARKYPEMRYLAYFQAYTNTYAQPLERLKRMYDEALSVDGVVGLVIGTRPDCVTGSLLDYLGELARQVFVTVEYGIESANDATLAAINRGHDFECARRAVAETAERGITTGAHVIYTDVSDNKRHEDGRRICPQTVSHLLCRKIYRTDSKLSAKDKGRPGCREVHLAVAARHGHRTKMGAEEP